MSSGNEDVHVARALREALHNGADVTFSVPAALRMIGIEDPGVQRRLKFRPRTTTQATLKPQLHRLFGGLVVRRVYVRRWCEANGLFISIDVTNGPFTSPIQSRTLGRWCVGRRRG